MVEPSSVLKHDVKQPAHKKGWSKELGIGNKVNEKLKEKESEKITAAIREDAQSLNDEVEPPKSEAGELDGRIEVKNEQDRQSPNIEIKPEITSEGRRRRDRMGKETDEIVQDEVLEDLLIKERRSKRARLAKDKDDSVYHEVSDKEELVEVVPQKIASSADGKVERDSHNEVEDSVRSQRKSKRELPVEREVPVSKVVPTHHKKASNIKADDKDLETPELKEKEILNNELLVSSNTEIDDTIVVGLEAPVIEEIMKNDRTSPEITIQGVFPNAEDDEVLVVGNKISNNHVLDESHTSIDNALTDVKGPTVPTSIEKELDSEDAVEKHSVDRADDIQDSSVSSVPGIPELNRVPPVGVPVANNDTVVDNSKKNKGRKKSSWKERLQNSSIPIADPSPIVEREDISDDRVSQEIELQMETRRINGSESMMNNIVDTILNMPDTYNSSVHQLESTELSVVSDGRVRLWLLDLSYESIDWIILSFAVFWTFSRLLRMRTVLKRSERYFKELSLAKVKYEKSSEERYKASAIAIANITESLEKSTCNFSKSNDEGVEDLNLVHLNKVIENQNQLTNEVLKFVQDEMFWTEGE